jgi:type II secretory ATPase GspE/PulE/Tfp pilus assembly ATPase PilB-like protein
VEPHDELLAELQMDRADMNEEGVLYHPKGCGDCHDTGYSGRTGVYEVFQLSSKLRKMILDRASTRELKTVAIEEGMLTLRKDGIRKMLLGDTTPEEVLRETAAD